MGHLRAAVLRHHDQLHRSSGARYPGAGSAEGDRLVGLDYGRIVIAFQVSYAVMMLVWGGILDRIGTKVGLAIAVAWWSLAGMGTASARSAMGFGFARFMLGVGEAANFPASIKTVAEWFPKSAPSRPGSSTPARTSVPSSLPSRCRCSRRRGAGAPRSFSPARSGSSGSRRGGPSITRCRRTRTSSRPSALIRDGADETSTSKVSIGEVLGHRQLWAFALGKMLTDPVWWFYLFWLPKFLASEHGIRGIALIPYLTTVSSRTSDRSSAATSRPP